MRAWNATEAAPALVGAGDASPRHASRPFARPLTGALLALFGTVLIAPTLHLLWGIWLGDPLKSIGALVLPVSFFLILRVWRAMGWRTEPNWWGFVLLAAVFCAVQLREHAVLVLVLSPSVSVSLPPLPVLVLGYVAGMVLAVGGVPLFRAALFPIGLSLLVTPVPHLFTRLADLPLQHAAAAVARGFAHLIGEPLGPEQLKLMFTPEFGMFIAPGCDGLRGAVTLGFLALVAGYLYRFRARYTVLAILAGILLGYLFNLLRLCLLVLFYEVALHWTFLQGHAEGADYLIGASLFFVATLIFFAAVRRLGPTGDLRLPAPSLPAFSAEPSAKRQSAAWGVFAAVGLLVVAGGAVAIHGASIAQEDGPAPQFPSAAGEFQLQRTWQETVPGGGVAFSWAEYARPGGAAPIAIGFSPSLGAHDSLLCHTARGETWLWHRTLNLPANDGHQVSFSTVFFSRGDTGLLEASTLCAGGHCGQWSSGKGSIGLVWSRPADLLRSDAKPVPVLLEAASSGRGNVSSEGMDGRLLQELAAFVNQVPLASWAGKWGPQQAGH